MVRKAMTMILAAMLLGGAATIPTMALARGGGHGGGGHFGRATLYTRAQLPWRHHGCDARDNEFANVKSESETRSER
jgi:Spy/CpxP family protein refolding chaperone